MKSTKSEALLLFKKWKDESTPLICLVTLPPMRAGLERARLESFGELGVSVRSEDGNGKIAFTFPSSVIFGFGDKRLVPPELQVFETGVSIFPDESSISRREGLLLLERI